MKNILFISHDSKDRAIAKKFQHVIQSLTVGILDVFFASDPTSRSSVNNGNEWFQETMDKLKNCTEFISILSKTSISRPWVCFEAGFARANKEGKVPTIGLLINLDARDLSGHPLSHYKIVSASDEELEGLLKNIASRAGCHPSEDQITAAASDFRKSIQDFQSIALSKKELTLIDIYRRIVSQSKTTMAFLECLNENSSVGDSKISQWIEKKYGFSPDFAHIRHMLFSLAKAKLLEIKTGKIIKITPLGRIIYDNVIHRVEHPGPAVSELDSLRELIGNMDFLCRIIRTLHGGGSMSEHVVVGAVGDGADELSRGLADAAVKGAIVTLMCAGIVERDGPTRVRLTSDGMELALDFLAS